jgi:hypothetical protein
MTYLFRYFSSSLVLSIWALDTLPRDPNRILPKMGRVRIRILVRSLSWSGTHSGKVVVEFPRPFQDNMQGTEVVHNTTQADFDKTASYLLVGGLGGLGRALAV